MLDKVSWLWIFHFMHYKYIVPLPFCKVSAEILADSLFCGFPCMGLFVLLLLPLEFSTINFAILIICVGVSLLRFIFFEKLCAAYTWISVFISRSRKLFSHNFIKYIVFPLSIPSSSSRTPMIWMLLHLILYQRFLKIS